MTKTKRSVGIDIGSVSVKLVLLEDGNIVSTVYRRFRGSPFETLLELLTNEFSALKSQSFYLGCTGIGGKTVQSIIGGKFYGEIASLAAGNFRVIPRVTTVIEMGGEDSKFLELDSSNKLVIDFAMNAQCAAGTGSFLDQQANRLKINIEEEFGALALKSVKPPRIAGRCSVFAKSDMIHLQQIATPDYDIVAGLCFAVARNFKSSIARGKSFKRPIAFEGGVAANPGMVRAFTELLELDKGELIIPEHYNVIGALGAAILAQEGQVIIDDFDPRLIQSYLAYRKVPPSGRDALSFSFPDSKHYDVTLAERPKDISNLDVFLGIDVGSLSTNLVLVDSDHRLIARRYLMTEGRPIDAVRRGLEEIGTEVGDRVIVRAVGTTGSGRYLTSDYVGGDIVRNEITAQATAAIDINPQVDTIFEIGGQDSKYISIDRRAVVDFEMNKACAAGTGSFLQEQAEKLNIRIETEFGEKALRAKCPVGCGERCTVFMESDLVAHQRSGAGKDDLIAGLAYSIVSNYLTKVVGDRRIGDNIFFQGGVAWNKAVVAAFEKLIGKRVTVPPHHDVTGAIGAAILAMEEVSRPGFKTLFRGFDLHRRKYTIETFTCEDCPNQCEINKVEIQGEEPLYYGSRCEKYDVKRGAKRELPPNYAALRQKLLYKKYLKFAKPATVRGRVGIPRALLFFEYFPFWQAFFESLGFEVVKSDTSNHSIVEDALELFNAETCYPIKLVYGHVANLLDKDVDYIFLPSLIKVAEETDQSDDGAYVCLWVQTIGSSIRIRFDFEKAGVKLVTPVISLSHDLKEVKRSLKQLAGDFHLSERELNRAAECGLRAYRMYKRSLYAEGDRVLGELKPGEKALVVVSRPYNGYDRELSADLPKKIRSLGYKAVPLDFLRLDEGENDLSYMYWHFGRSILSAAEKIRKHPNLFAVYLSSFACGPDSFITHFFRREMSGKPYLQLELDEHSADAGLITRCEAFLDSLRFYRFQPPVKEFHIADSRLRSAEKTVYIPYMCDHAFAIRAAMERYGLSAQVLDEPDSLTLEYGKKYTSGKECFPCIVTTGDMIKKIRSNGADRDKMVFFMPGADGPCRFGVYCEYHRMMLDDLGYRDIPILSPNSQNGYAGFGLEGTGFRKLSWGGLVFIDCLAKMLHSVRPYEVTRGETEKLYLHYLGKLDRTMVRGESLEKLAEEAAQAFREIETTGERRPLVGVVGEIFLRHNRFSNNFLIEKLEKMGLEVRLATFCEWPLYTSLDYQRDSFRDHNWKAWLHGGLQMVMQTRNEHKLTRHFSRYMDIGHEYPVGKVLELASDYLALDFKGEALLSIGKAIEMAREDAAGIVNAMPFNCMPGTLVTSLSKKVAEDLGSIPWLNISYEGLRDSGEDTRLEAFAEQVRVFSRGAGKRAKQRV